MWWHSLHLVHHDSSVQLHPLSGVHWIRNSPPDSLGKFDALNLKKIFDNFKIFSVATAFEISIITLFWNYSRFSFLLPLVWWRLAKQIPILNTNWGPDITTQAHHSSLAHATITTASKLPNRCWVYTCTTTLASIHQLKNENWFSVYFVNIDVHHIINLLIYTFFYHNTDWKCYLEIHAWKKTNPISLRGNYMISITT